MKQKTKRSTTGVSESNEETLLQRLTKLRAVYGRDAANQKLISLKRARSFVITDITLLKLYHDLLCFLRAYPDNATILKLTEGELLSFGERIEQCRRLSDSRKRKLLSNSGMADTVVEHPFSLKVTELLLDWYPENLSVDWQSLDEEVTDEILSLLPFLVSWQENDTFDNDPYVDAEGWLTRAKGKTSRSDLETLVRLLKTSPLMPQLQHYLWESIDLSVSWQLGSSIASRTRNRVPVKRIYFQKTPLRRRTGDLRAELARPAAPLRLLPKSQGRNYVRKINEVLAARYRELYPITFANESEVYLYEPGRGVQIVIYGSIPEVRLPLESNFGAMLVRNGMPIGYGICATLFERVEIAINIFPAFRSGESSFIIEQFFKLFCSHFGSRVLLVRSRQMGDGDMEPLHSGAFWFYYKLGFRAVKPRIRRLAEEEYEQLQRHGGYRSPINMLRRLSRSDVILHLNKAEMDDWKELSIVNLGYAVTRYAAEKFDGNRELMVRRLVALVVKKLGVKERTNWTINELEALRRLAPLLATIPDLAGWPSQEKAALVAVIRAKGGPQERKYALLSGRHIRLERSLRALAANEKQAARHVGRR